MRRAVREDALFAATDTVLCATSGGPDSTALLHVLARLRGSLGHRVVACAIDHGLRSEAGAEIAQVESLARELEVPMEIVALRVEPGGNLQARARSARWEALIEVAGRLGAATIATGHTADDRAETVLLRLLRGAGPRGLAVLPPRDGVRVRPLLRARRRDVLEHLRRHGLAFAEDPSNRDPRFARVRVRLEVLPLLETLAPRVVESLCHLADALGPLRDADDPWASLGRAQRGAIDRAIRLGQTTARVRIAGARELVVDLDPPEESRSPGGAEIEAHGESSGPPGGESAAPSFPAPSRSLTSKIVPAPGHRRDRLRR